MVGPWFTTPWRLVSQSHGAVAWCFRSPFPSHVRFPYAASRHWPIIMSPGLPTPPGCCAAPSHPSSRVYTPVGRQQPCGASPLDPHPSGDRFVRLASVAPFPPPPLSPVPRPRSIPRFPRRPSPLGPSYGSSHTPFSVLSPFPCILFFFIYRAACNPVARPFGSAAFPAPVGVPSTGRPLHAPFRLRVVLP